MTELFVRALLLFMKSPDLLFSNVKFKSLTTALMLCLILGSGNAWSQSLVPELTFTNPRLKTCHGCSAAGQDGAVYIFSNVGYGIDALVTIRSRSSAEVTLISPDWNGPADTSNTDLEDAWQPRVAFRDGEAPAHRRWWMEFSISFVSHGNHSKPVQVNQFLVTGLHLGGDGQHLHEFQTYYQPRSATRERSISLEQSGSPEHSRSTEQSRISEQSGSMKMSFVKGCLESRVEKGFEFSGLAVPETKYGGSGNRKSEVNTVYRGTSRMVVRVGAETGAGSSHYADRNYAFSFRSLFFDVPKAKPARTTMLACNDKSIATKI